MRSKGERIAGLDSPRAPRLGKCGDYPCYDGRHGEDIWSPPMVSVERGA
jgi:hypothetical protein